MNCLRVIPLEFTFEAQQAIAFRPYMAGNVVRGALGRVLHDHAPEEYKALFTPQAGGVGPSGLENRPRPFVLRTGEFDGRSFAAQERFTLHVNSFVPLFETFRQAFEQFDWKLVDAVQKPEVQISLEQERRTASELRIRFLAPTELKHEASIVREPRFDVLLKRARDRVSSLCSVYQGAPLEADYAGLGRRAQAIKMTRWQGEQVDSQRRSGGTGQQHGIGGFVGEAEYSGDLGEFVPWLEAAEWTGVGRFTVWGNGALKTEILR